MLSFAQNGSVAGDSAFRIYEVGSVERSATFFALVAICTFSVAMGTFSGDVSIGEELVGFFIEKLH